jgi:hypothetical protein
MRQPWKKQLQSKAAVAVTGFLLVFPLLGAARSSDAATKTPAKLTVTLHYEEVYHLDKKPVPGELGQGTGDAKLLIDFTFERPILIDNDKWNPAFLTYGVNGPVNMSGSATYTLSSDIAYGKGHMIDEARFTGGLTPDGGSFASAGPYGKGLSVNYNTDLTLQGKSTQTITGNGKDTVTSVFSDVLLGGTQVHQDQDDPHKVTINFQGQVWPPGGSVDAPQQTKEDAADFSTGVWIGSQATHSADGSWHLQYTGHKTKISADNDPWGVKTTRTLVIDATVTPTGAVPKKKTQRKK